MHPRECKRVHPRTIHSNKGIIGREPGALYGSRYRIESRCNLHVVMAQVVSKGSCSTAAKVFFLGSRRRSYGGYVETILVLLLHRDGALLTAASK